MLLESWRISKYWVTLVSWKGTFIVCYCYERKRCEVEGCFPMCYGSLSSLT
jgi:hypothetical protein